MKIRIDFGNPLISPEQVESLSACDLNDFYAVSSNFDRTNLCFVLLNSIHKYEAEGKQEYAAKLCFLLACYLFVPLTPPGSASLALYYMDKAIALDTKPEYLEWLELIRKGN